MPGRFKDFVAMPKVNRYRSLHTTVIGPEGRPLEIQVRTRDDARDRRARNRGALGVQGRPKKPPADAEWREWVKQLMDTSETEAGSVEFLKTFRTDLFEDEVYVFTPRGEVKTLPAGATPIDFAYAVHTDVGHRTVGAKVNGRIVPLHYRLANGDFVEILTSKSGRGPSRDWMKIAAVVARAQQDPRVVLARDARRHRAEGPRGARAGAEVAEPAAQEARGLGRARAGDPRSGLQEGGGLLPRARLGQGRRRRRSSTR